MSRFASSTLLELVLITSVIFVSGCGGLKTTSYMSPPDSRLRNYKALEIPEFETDMEDVPEEALLRLPKEIARVIQERNIGFREVVYGETEASTDESTLVMFGEITDYTSGKDIKFEKGAIKFAEAELTILLSILDKSTGREITSGEISGLSSFGFLKKGFFTKGVYEALAEEIAKFLAENY
ncbi:MAG: hypothetical protein V3U74_05210 [Thermodesulfobacteriota bacterium]